MTDVSSDDEDTIDTERKRLRKIFKKGLYALYFIGIMFSLRNRVQIYGALRPKEHFNSFGALKEVEKKKGLFVSLLNYYLMLTINFSLYLLQAILVFAGHFL